MPPGSRDRRLVRVGGNDAASRLTPAFGNRQSLVAAGSSEIGSQRGNENRLPFTTSPSPTGVVKSRAFSRSLSGESNSLFVRSSLSYRQVADSPGRPPSSPPPVPSSTQQIPATISFAQTRQNAARAQAAQRTAPGFGLGGRTHATAGGRTRRVPRDSINGISTASIRRLARRGGVKRISATVYADIRRVLRDRLSRLLQLAVTLASHRARIIKDDGSVENRTITIMLQDVLYSLRSFGTPIYGFEPLETSRS